MPARIVVVGDALLDRDLEGRVERLCPDAPVPIVEQPVACPRPGGAGLAAALAAADGHEVMLVTALGRDPAGRELHQLLDGAGVEVADVGLRTATPEKVRVRTEGRTLLRMDHGGPRPGRHGAVGSAVLKAISSADAVLISDYGWGITADPALRASISQAAAAVPAVWDPHPSGASPVPGMRLVKPNRGEAGGEHDIGALAASGRRLLREWRSDGVAITLGSEGALLLTGEEPPFAVPARSLAISDPCGAGDRFSAAAVSLLAGGATLQQAVAGAVEAASAFVAAGGAAAATLGQGVLRLAPVSGTGIDHALQVIAGVRARSGRVIATGGCFDLLHAGHVSVLAGARALGDCLVVCLNSDASVRRLKGPGRPLAREADRAAVLNALGAVDAVVIFEEDTPLAVLGLLKPDVFAKGADYAAAELPERSLLASWGGQVVLLPYLEGRSTSKLVEEVGRRATG